MENISFLAGAGFLSSTEVKYEIIHIHKHTHKHIRCFILGANACQKYQKWDSLDKDRDGLDIAGSIQKCWAGLS